MRHPLVPSLEVHGALSLDYLSDHSFFGHPPKDTSDANHNSVSSPSYAPSGLPSPILYVDRMPRRRHTDDCLIEVGTIAAWSSVNRASQGVFFLQIDEALEFIRLARRGIHTRYSSVFRAASITKFNPKSGTDDHSLVVDAELLTDRTPGDLEWIRPGHIDPIPHT